MNLRVYCDGAKGKWGWYAENEIGVQGFGVGYMGSDKTTNEGEYASLLGALYWLIFQSLELYDNVLIQMDSQLIVNQMNGEWAVRAKNLGFYHRQAMTLYGIVDNMMALGSDHKRERFVLIDWEPRTENVIVDRLSKLPTKIAEDMSWDISR